MSDPDFEEYMKQVERAAEALRNTINSNLKVSEDRRDSAVMLVNQAVEMVVTRC